MFAVIQTGGKQYRVKQGDRLRVESLQATEGDSINIEQVLIIGEGAEVVVGDPLVKSASVSATVLAHGRGKKVQIIKFRRRKHHRKQMGHRQNYTELEITAINGGPAGLQSIAQSGTASTADKETLKAAASPADSSDKSALVAGSLTATTPVEATAAAATDLKFLDTPNGEPDDLKNILGIGPVLEERLNDLGIYHYSQIAEFSDADITNVNTHLNFPGRIERDEWIPQAKILLDGGEGRKLKYLDAPDGEKDDLKLISGVGPVLEGKLNELGIYHFWQIGTFEQKDIDLVNDAMAFPGRIERDEWISQAQSLADGGAPK